MYKILILSILLTLLISCDPVETPQLDDQITVEGWIDEGGHPIVMLTKAILVDHTARDVSNLSDYIVKWAKVTISDGEHSEILTGKYNPRYYPPYIYTTSNIVGKAGKTYSLLVEYKNYTITALTTIPHHVDIDTAFAVPSTDSTDFGIKIIFNDNPSTHDYYKTFSNCDSTSNMYLSTIMQTIDDSYFSKREIENIVYRGRYLDKEYKHGFSRGEIVMVKLCHIDSISYAIWKDYENSLSFSRNPILRYNNNITTNITGGLGYWCGYGASEKIIEVK